MKSADQPNIPSVVIAVDDVNEQMKKVTAAGGKVIGEPQEIPGIGLGWSSSIAKATG